VCDAPQIEQADIEVTAIMSTTARKSKFNLSTTFQYPRSGRQCSGSPPSCRCKPHIFPLKNCLLNADLKELEMERGWTGETMDKLQGREGGPQRASSGRHTAHRTYKNLMLLQAQAKMQSMSYYGKWCLRPIQFNHRPRPSLIPFPHLHS
jgi:hypothetical protein